MSLPSWIVSSSRLLSRMQGEIQIPAVTIKKDPSIVNLEDLHLVLRNIVVFDICPYPDDLYLYIIKNRTSSFAILEEVFLVGVCQYEGNTLYEHLFRNLDKCNMSLFSALKNIYAFDNTTYALAKQTQCPELIKFIVPSQLYTRIQNMISRYISDDTSDEESETNIVQPESNLEPKYKCPVCRDHQNISNMKIKGINKVCILCAMADITKNAEIVCTKCQSIHICYDCQIQCII